MKKVMIWIAIIVVLAGIVVGAMYARSAHEDKVAEQYLNQMIESKK